jgi:hypothetical protein
VVYISIDPGKNVGVATFRENGEDINKRIMDLNTQFRDYLTKLYALHANSEEPIRFIMEDFKLRKDKALEQTGSDMPAPRCIGAVEMMCTLFGEDRASIHYIPPGNIKTSLKWAGYSALANKPRGYHPPDDIVAYSHGVFALINLKLRKHPIFS